MRHRTRWTVLACALAALAFAAPAQAHLLHKPKTSSASKLTRFYTRELAHAEGAVAFARHHRKLYPSSAFQRAVIANHRWLAAEARAKIAALRYSTRPPHYTSWLCIHRHEGAWDDRGDPYWGGLQMDRGFMSTYGGWLWKHKGTADRWTPLEQMWVAERAYASGRGFYPWPNTARVCGLL